MIDIDIIESKEKIKYVLDWCERKYKTEDRKTVFSIETQAIGYLFLLNELDNNKVSKNTSIKIHNTINKIYNLIYEND